MQTKNLSDAISDEKELSEEIARLHTEVNRLAVSLSGCQGSEANYVWSNLANARAYLATALEASRDLKAGHLRSQNADWQI